MTDLPSRGVLPIPAEQSSRGRFRQTYRPRGAIHSQANCLATVCLSGVSFHVCKEF